MSRVISLATSCYMLFICSSTRVAVMPWHSLHAGDRNGICIYDGASLKYADGGQWSVRRAP